MSAMRAVSDEYMKLVREFPLIHIQNKSHLKQAGQIIDKLSDKLDLLSRDQREYFNVLCDLVHRYESRDRKPNDKMTPQEALRYLMEENRLTQADLTPIVRHKSHLSAFLNGKRGLSKANAIRLAKRFNVSPALFLKETD